MTRAIPPIYTGFRVLAQRPVLIIAGVLIACAAAAMGAEAEEKAVVRDRGQPAAAAPAALGDLHALVVGISKYRDAAIPPLKFAAKDAGDFAAFLETQRALFKNVHVKLLTDSQATRNEIEKCLLYDLRKAGKDDSVIVYFSGHGTIDPMQGHEYFFVTHDTDPEYVAASAVLLSGPRFLGGLSSRHVLVLADTCHAGSISTISTKSLPHSFQSFLKDFQQSSGRIIIASSKPGEYSLEQEGLGNSVFSHFFLEGVRGPADRDRDGTVSVREAYEYAYDRTKDATQGAQHPVFEGRLVGKFPLAYVKLPEGTVEFATEPLTDVYMRAERGFSRVAQTDASGRTELTGLPVDKPFIFMLKKKGWKDKILDPVSVTSERLRTRLARVQLDPAQSFLVVNAHAPGVKVRIGDKDAGETGEDSMLVVDNVQVGVPHNVSFSKPGYDEKVVALTIPESYEGRTFIWSQTLKQRIPVKPKTIEKLVMTDPADVEVYMDDGRRPIGVAGPNGLKVEVKTAGKVAFRFQKENYEPKTIEYDMSKDGVRDFPKVVMRRTKGDLLVHTQPGEISVSIAGEYRGMTDAGGQLLVKGVDVERTLHLDFTKQGYAPAKQDVKMASVPLHKIGPVKLTRLTGSLGLSADPPSADVSIAGAGDYKFTGKTDARGVIKVTDLPIDTQLMVTIGKTGWKAAQIGPVVCTPDALRIELPKVGLERAGATLLLKADVPGATVEIDGSLVGETGKGKTLRLEEITVGAPHEVVLRKEGYHERKFALTIPVATVGKVHTTPLIHLEKTPLAQAPPKPASGDQTAREAERQVPNRERGQSEAPVVIPAQRPSEQFQPQITGGSDRFRSAPGAWIEPPSMLDTTRDTESSRPSATATPARDQSAPSQPSMTGMSERYRSSTGAATERYNLPGH